MSKHLRISWLALVRLFWLAGWLAGGRAGAAESSAVEIGPPAGWVRLHTYDQQALAAPVEAGVDQRLLLFEQQIHAGLNERFVHSARQVLTLDGVQRASTVSVDFTPAYQSLKWHWVRLWRDGAHLERLETNSLRTIEKEPELDQYVVDGGESSVLVLDDVRVGDIIDYAYSIRGVNPVLGGKFSAAVPVQLDEPAGRLLTRVVWPRQRHLHALAHHCQVLPAAGLEGGNLDYVWDWREVAGVTPEDSLPADYDPEPWVQLSEYRSWAEVNQWALGLFAAPASLSPALAAKIAACRQDPDPERQILAALGFVQDEVRYFGIEIGASEERPADPSTVFARRYGDCKDKSVLLAAMLVALGFPAHPVLVNAMLHDGIADWQPSAAAFDHCIVVVSCQGRNFWLDPTMNYQRGPLLAHSLPDYGCGLVICPGTTALTVIPHDTGLPLTRTTEFFTLGERTEPAGLQVVTVAEGGDAEALREFFATNHRTDIERQYTHYYSDTYPGSRMTARVVVTDDAAANRFETTESYSIPAIWTLSEKDRRYRVLFFPTAIADSLKVPVDTERRMPLGITWPRHQILRTEVTLPRYWQPDADSKRLIDPAFAFGKVCRCGGRKLVMEYEYLARDEAVQPAGVPDYLAHLNQASQSLGYTLVWR